MPSWAVPSLPAHFATADQPPFVGRRLEMERLEAAWALTQRGERQAVFLDGEPGSGKSRLTAEMAKGLHVHDVAVLLGASSPDLGRPYGALVKALDHLLLGTEPGALADVIPDSAAELLRLTPHIHIHRPDLSIPTSADGEHREELFAAFVDLIEAIAADRPVAIVLEDMHWSSPAARRLMARIIESIHDRPLLVLVTIRNTAPDRSDDMSHTIADLHRLPGIHRIDLSPLATDDVQEYLRVELGHSDPSLPTAAALIRDQTGGNPFFLREVWRDLRRVVVAGSGLSAIRSRELATPSSVRDTLERRLRSFAPLDRTVLECAAVLGDAFDASNVVVAVDVDPAAVMEAFDHAAEAGLIVTTDPGRYAFQHALIRQALLEGLSPSKSAATHARIAESLRARHPDDSSLAPVLARLYERASPLGYHDEAIRYLEEAAVSARRSLAHEEAADLWEHAARLAGRDRRRREQMLLSAAGSHLLAGGFADARRIYREVNASDHAETALRAAIGFEDASWRPGLVGTDARAMLESSIDSIEPDPSHPLYVAACIALGRAHTFAGEMHTGERLGQEALAMARQLGNDGLIADALASEVTRTMIIPRADDTILDMAVQLREISLRNGDYALLAPAGSARTADGYMRADRTRFQEGWSDIRLAAEKTGQPFWRWVSACHEHVDHFMKGEFDAAIDAAARVKDLGYVFGSDNTEGPFGLQMYMVRRETGGLDAIRGLVSGDPDRDGTWTPGLLSLYTELGMKDAVRSLMGRSVDLAHTMDDREASYGAVIAFMVDAAVYLGDHQIIRRLLPYVEVFDESNLVAGQSVAVFGSGNTYLARMYASLGDGERAEHHFKRGLAMDVAIGSIVHQTWTLAHYAALLDETGRTGPAGEYRSRARQLAHTIGQERVLRLIGHPGGDDRLPDGLTQRELEVLRLLVEGASNKGIGERLFISQNTAANHVRSILMKTGSANRTVAAAYAREHDLA